MSSLGHAAAESQEPNDPNACHSIHASSHPLIVGPSSIHSDTMLSSSNTSGNLHAHNAVAAGAVNGDVGKSHTLSFQSDSDESNQSSSSTIDSSAGHSKDGCNVKKSKDRTKSSKRKKDRSTLRKGKWTVRT
jgi:PBP1b-binding outer membrane lipoprotein LpoB